ncbi:GTP-binding protein [Persicobacter psychrovividus]|uniref:Cobalamin biosynthesis protein CobW n=1 Tax=Persicobacter psychrovividus TaxID=387638 RepID=A0ABN6L9U9_9BACT|nr:cobalamin biosynthesis protein CobW [Persicobacter psychrovividus]
MQSNTPIKVTILTGFLGAGKTTLVNQLIHDNPATRFAIIENEFGKSAIDQELITEENAGIFELANGCICCNLNADLAKILTELITSSYEFDHLLIETTGIADPLAVAATFMFDPHYAGIFKLDGIIALADALHLEEMMEKEAITNQQLAAAHIVLLNKTDLVSADDLQRIEAKIQSVTPFIKIIPCQQAKVENELLFNLRGKDYQVVEQQSKIPATTHQHGKIQSITWESDQAIDLHKLEAWLTMTLQLQPNIYRLKGILYALEYNNKIIIQSVGQQFYFTQGSEWQHDSTTNKVVIIGNQLNKSIIFQGLDGCLA